MLRLRLSDRAVSDLKQIWEYVSQDSLTAADRQIDLLKDKFTLLAAQPLLGELREDLELALRAFTAGSYLVLYVVTPNEVEIVAVVHAARDIQATLRSLPTDKPD